MTPEELAAIKERADKATAADALTLSKYAHGGGRLYVVGGPNAERQLVADFYDEDNRQFYYNARTDVPALVAEVERLRRVEAERDALRIEYARLDRIEDEAARIAVGHLSDMQLTGGAKRCFDALMHALHVQTELPEEARIAALRAAESGD